MSTFKLEVFEKSAHPIVAKRYREGQEAALAGFEVSADYANGCHDLPGTVYLITAEDEQGRMVGGCRFTLRVAGNQLPSERNLGDAAFTEELASRLEQRPFETGSTWIDRSCRKAGLLHPLFLSGYALARMHGARIGYGTAHEKIAPAYERLGAVVDRSRVFFWPDERFRTYICRGEMRAIAGPGAPFEKPVDVLHERIGRGLPYFFRAGDTASTEARDCR